MALKEGVGGFSVSCWLVEVCRVEGGSGGFGMSCWLVELCGVDREGGGSGWAAGWWSFMVLTERVSGLGYQWR